MTFFEFVIEQLLGPPFKRKGNGESFWACPRCGSDSFHTRPTKPGQYKDSVKCFRCDYWGDEFDVMKLCKVGSSYPEQKRQIDVWKRDYRDEYEPDERVANGLPIPPGTGTDDAPAVETAYFAMTPAERATMYQAWLIANWRGIWVGRLAPYCYWSWHALRTPARVALLLEQDLDDLDELAAEQKKRDDLAAQQKKRKGKR